MSVLNVNVSRFKSGYAAADPEEVNLLEWLTSDTYRDIVGVVRSIEDKKDRDEAKMWLPSITPSGLFSYRKMDCLTSWSGLLQVDIDSHHNESDLNIAKQMISVSPFIAYCGLSTSGKGLWALIPIKHPDRFREHFSAILEDFQKIGINIDKKVSSVVSLRFASYDPSPYINHKAKTYERLIERKVREVRPGRVDDERVMEIIQDIVDNNIDVTTDYESWLKTGCAFANHYGEDGRGLFHLVSQFHESYDADDCDRQFDRCLEGKYPYSIGSFIYLYNLNTGKYEGSINSLHTG